MPAFLLTFGQMFLSFASSRVGNIVFAALIAFVWGHHRADVACREEAADAQVKLERAFWAEVDRQRKVAKEIEDRARQREGENAVVARAMQAKIDEYAKKESKDVSSEPPLSPVSGATPRAPRSCVVDDDFARVVRSLDAAGRRRGAPSR